MINNFSKVPGNKINLEKSVVFLYNNKHAKKEIMNTLRFIIASQKINILGSTQPRILNTSTMKSLHL